MEFHMDKNLKRHCSRKIIGATTGGRVTFVLCSICTVLFFVSLYALIYCGDYERNSDEAIMWFYSAFAFSAFFMAGPFGLVCTCLRRNICVGLRKKEHLFIEDGWLRYSFHIVNDRDTNGLNEIAINLRECNLQLGQNGECMFTGGVVGWHYENILHNYLRSLDEMEPVSSFEIWPYWSPDLYETLLAEQRRLTSV